MPLIRSPFFSPPAPVYVVESPPPQAVVSTASGSTMKSASMIVALASEAAVRDGGEGGVVPALSVPPLKTPPVPLRLQTPLGVGAVSVGPEFAQSNEAPGDESNRTLLEASSSRKLEGCAPTLGLRPNGDAIAT